MTPGLSTSATAPAPRRVALLGGSFDPIHRGHLALARAALTQLPVDELWWLPAGQPWQKARQLASARDRVAMLEAALHDAFGPDTPDGLRRRQRIETCEIERSGPTYTIETLIELGQRHPHTRWILLLGADQARGLPTWHRWQEILERADVAVAGRPGVEDVPAGRGITIDLPPHDISSTDIRRRAAASLPLGDQVTPGVERYIAAHHLYRASA